MTTPDPDFSVPPLLACQQSFVTDPAYADTVDVDRTLVTVGQPTSGPNRYTIHVPTEKTVLSLGAASPRWKTDKGITGHTDSHVHFETKTGVKTVVSLGGPATTATVKGYGGSAPVSTHGYSMVTVGNAWHEAAKQHYLLSRTEDISLRTKGEGQRAVLQADQGIVDLNGGEEVNLAGGGVAIGAHEGLHFEDIKYAESWAGETPHSIAAKRAAKFNAITSALGTAHNLVMSAIKMRKEKKAGHLHWSVDSVSDVGEWLADAAEFWRTKGEIQELYSAEEAVEGCIKIDAQEDFGVSAGGEASFFGGKGASLGSAIWTSVSAVVSASLKGTLFAGVSAAYTSLKGYKKIELGCDNGNALFDAKKNVQISADNSLIAVGKEVAMVSGDKKAFFSSKTNAWIGTTAGGGWGLHFNAAGLMIGKATSADKMMAAAVAPDRSIKFESPGKEKNITFTSSSTVMTLTKRYMNATASSVDLKATSGDVNIGGKKVLIDGP